MLTYHTHARKILVRLQVPGSIPKRAEQSVQVRVFRAMTLECGFAEVNSP